MRDFYDIKGKNSTEVIAKRGIPSETIIQVANEYPNSMIMAGYKGVRPLAEMFFGSTAQSLVFNSKHPIWIHRGNKVIKPEKVLVPHDLSLESNRAIDVLRDLSLTSPIRYEVFFVDDHAFPVLDYKTYSQKEKKHIDETFAKIKHLKGEYPDLPFVTAKGNITNKIVKKARNFDMLMMAHHNPSGLFTGRETVDILKHVNKPALIVQ